MQDKLTYSDVIDAIEMRAFPKERLNAMVTDLVGCAFYQAQEPDLNPTGRAVWTLPDGARLETSVRTNPDFLGNIDIAKSLVPADRAWNYTFVPKQPSTAIVVAAPTFDGPGYRGTGVGAEALVIAALKARKGINGLV